MADAQELLENMKAKMNKRNKQGKKNPFSLFGSSKKKAPKETQERSAEDITADAVRRQAEFNEKNPNSLKILTSDVPKSGAGVIGKVKSFLNW